MEYIMFSAADYDEFIVLRGKRVKTEEHPFWPFFRATFILDKASAMRLGQERITVSESDILSDCEVPVKPSAPKPPPVQNPKPKPPVQLTLWETA